jgi:hypothetical protein
MKRATAFHHAREIHERLTLCGGLIATPWEWSGILFSQVWVFGSMAKGAPLPNDLDVLVDCKVWGQFDAKLVRPCWENGGRNNSYGYAFTKLREGLRMISIHTHEGEEYTVGKVEIYPRFELRPEADPNFVHPKGWNRVRSLRMPHPALV